MGIEKMINGHPNKGPKFWYEIPEIEVNTLN